MSPTRQHRKPASGLPRFSPGHPGTHPGPEGYPHDAPHPPPAGASKNRGTEIRGPSSTTSGGPHFCAHELEQTSASRVRPATPHLDRANKGRHADTPWPVVDNFRRAFLFVYVLPAAARNSHPHTHVAPNP